MENKKGNFFPSENYKIPSASNYMKLIEGKNKFRILSSAIVGYIYWNTDNKPVRSKDPFEEIPNDIKVDKEGKFRINHFWAFVVWNYEAKKVQILELTQKGIMGAIKSYVDEESWGNPKSYDLVVTRTGSGFDTEYQTIANPHSPVPVEAEKEYAGKKINLEALYHGADPFNL